MAVAAWVVVADLVAVEPSNPSARGRSLPRSERVLSSDDKNLGWLDATLASSHLSFLLLL